jgi:hypothetical protein
MAGSEGVDDIDSGYLLSILEIPGIENTAFSFLGGGIINAS